MSNKDLDTSLLDRELDDIEDLPGFAVPYNGEYLLKLKTEMKAVNNKTAVEFSYEVLECIKKDNDEDPDAKAGDKFSNLYFLEGEPDAVKISLGKLKELVAGIAEASGQSNLGVLIRDVVAEAVVKATVKRRQDKEDKEKFYPIVKNLELA